MKKRKSKFLLSSLTLLSLSAIPVAGISSIKNMNSNLAKVDSDLQASSSRNISVNNLTMQLNKDYQSLDWYGKNFANTVTEEQLKQLIVPNLKFDVNYGFNILNPTGDALSNGYVEFTVYQIKNSFSGGVTTNPNGSGATGQTADGRTLISPVDNITQSDGTASTIDMRAYPNDNGDTVINDTTVKKNMVWTTKNITGLFLPLKYSFSWNDNEKIGDFLSSTNKSILTAQDVFDNMISRSKITDSLPTDTVSNASIITFSQNDADLSQYGISGTDAQNYGIGVVKVDFSTSANEGGQANNWVNSTVPKDQKYLVRGLLPTGSNSTKEEMKLNISDDSAISFLNTSLSVSAIQAENKNFKLPSGATSGATSVTISQFTPTELINALPSSTSSVSSLYKLLTQDTYLNKTNNANQLPALHLTYMGKTSTSRATTGSTTAAWGGTGLYQMGKVPTVKNGVIDYNDTRNPADSSGVTNVLATADNASGTLYLNVTYNKYNVYQNTMEIGLQTSITITGLQTDDSASINNQNLYFQWKSIDQLIFSSAQDVLNLYNSNSNDSAYLKSLSNLFFEGSDNTYQLDREVTMSVNGNVLTINLNFSRFGDLKDGATFGNTYTLNGTSARSAGITFKSQSDVASRISSVLGKDLSTVTPSEVINELVTNNSRGLLNLTDFYSTSGSSTYSALILQNDTNDGIVIEVLVTSGDTITSKHSYIYNGMAKGTSTSHIYNFAFGADNSELSSGLATLRNIPINLITKEDVYNYYVSRLPIYSGENRLSLTMDDFEITKDTGNNSITISINVAIVADGSENGSKTYSNTLKGFTNATIVNNNS
ncbi:hypothetical protein D8X55_04270, partial [Malacoplasma penetrans]